MVRKKFDLRDTVLRGLPWKLRHAWIEAGEGLGEICRKCGAPRPRMTEREQPCPGKRIFTREELRGRRELSIPSMLLAWAIGRQVTTLKDEFDPEILQAIAASSRRPFAGMDWYTMDKQLDESLEDSKNIFQAVPADTDPRTHTQAVAMFCLKLVDQDLIEDKANQAVLVSLRLLEEAEDTGSYWRYIPGVTQPLADKMLKHAEFLGYYGGKIRSLPNIRA